MVGFRAAVFTAGFVYLCAAAAEVERSPVVVLYSQVPRAFLSHSGLVAADAANLLDWMKRDVQSSEFIAFTRGSRAVSAPRTTLWLANATAARLTPDEIRVIETSPLVERVVPDGTRSRVVSRIEAADPVPVRYTYGLTKLRIPEIRSSLPGADGAGVSVGVIDTGADATHPDLVGRVTLFRDFTKIPKPAPYDDHGHGTHVAGTIAGGQTSGRAIGVAPKASLVIAKAFNERGRGDDSDILRAMQWLADPDGDSATPDAPHIVSNSWGNGEDYKRKEPSEFAFCRAVDAWVALGIMPVVAAGNEGPDGETVQLPGACPQSITVGATTESDSVWEWSSRGPSRWRAGVAYKPDVSAPGVSVYSAAPGGRYRERSGTSMATPHVAGVVALLLQARPRANLQEIRSALILNAKRLVDREYDVGYGAGRVDAKKALDWTISLPAQ